MAADCDLELIAERYLEGVDDLCLRIVARQRQELKELEAVEAPAVWDAVRAMTRESRLAQVTHLTNGRQTPATCPSPDIDAAQMAARAGLSALVVRQLYRIGHDESWKAWLEAIDEVELEETARRGCRREISEFVVYYDQAVSVLVGEEFERERRRVNGGDRDRLSLVRRVLDGSIGEVAELDYEMGQLHLGVIVMGASIDPALDQIRQQTSGPVLTAKIENELTMAWVGGGTDPGRSADQIMSPLKLPAATRLAVGIPAPGVDGFRRTHRQAGEAYLVAARGSDPVTFYESVQLEVMALSNESWAREFVANQLDGLGGNDEASWRLRETLRAYFTASQNAAAAAAVLGVHPHTVSRRLDIIEQRLGRQINQLRPELELALRLRLLLS